MQFNSVSRQDSTQRQTIHTACHWWACALLALAALTPVVGLTAADDVTFIPLSMNQGDTEKTTGMWLRPDLGTADQVWPLKTRVFATQESVTGKAAMKIIFEKGSTGKLAWELLDGSLKPNSAGMTLYAKCSRKATISVGNIPCEVGTDWTKIDLPWEKLGTTADKPSLGWQFIVVLQGPIEERTTLLLDRIGMETPRFDPAPKLEITAGPDAPISSKDIAYGAANLKKTLDRLKAKKKIKLFAFGDSVTAGAQCNRGTWNVKPEDGVQFLYFGTAARLWADKFGCPPLELVHRGHGGWTAAQALNIIDKDVVNDCGPDDLVIIQFGGNDVMAGATPEKWKADTHKLIEKVKTKTDQILLVLGGPGEKMIALAPAMNKQLQELVAEDKVAAVDLSKALLARGEPYVYGCYANLFHPDFCGHIMLGEMVAPILTGDEKKFPE